MNQHFEIRHSYVDKSVEEKDALIESLSETAYEPLSKSPDLATRVGTLERNELRSYESSNFVK